MPKLKGYIQEISERNRDCVDIPVYSVTNSNGFVPSTEYFSKEVFSKNLSAYKIVSRNMLAYNPSRINVGSVACQDKEERVLVSPLYIVLQTDETRLLPEYLNLFLHSDIALQQIRSLTSGSVRDSLKYTALEQLFLPIPDILSQMKIMESLHAITSLISLRRQQLEKLQQLAKSQFMEMFGDPIENPMRWDKLGLLEIGDCKNGMNFGPNEKGYTLSCIGVGDFKDRFLIDDFESIPLISVNTKPTPELLLKDGDILFVRSNGNKTLVGRSIMVLPGEKETTFSGFCIRYRLKSDKILPLFFLHYLRQDSIRKLLQGRGANIQNLNQKTIADISIFTPPLSLQEKFASFIAHLDKSKFAIEESIRKLELLYRSKLQEYFG